MTTFTSDDREEAYKNMHEDVVPIPFAGWVNTAPPHIVDSGASVMGMNANQLADSIDKYLDSILEEAIHPIEDVLNQSIAMLRQQQAEISLLQEYVCQLEKGLESSLNLNKAQAERQAKILTDEEIRTIQDMCHLKNVGYNTFIMRFARAILRKAQEK